MSQSVVFRLSGLGLRFIFGLELALGLGLSLGLPMLFSQVKILTRLIDSLNHLNFYLGWVWLAQLVKSLPSNHKVPSLIPGSVEI